MIVNLHLTLERPALPKDYRPSFISYVKSALSRHYPEAFAAFYGENTQKDFTFSVALPHPSFETDSIVLDDTRIKIRLSSCAEEDTLLFYNTFIQSRSRPHPLPGHNTMTLQAVTLEPVPTLQAPEAHIKFFSPLVVREHAKGNPDRYYIFGDEPFASCLSHVVFRHVGGETRVALEPIAPRKTVVPCFGTKIRATIGTFRLTGERDVLNILLRGGMGSRRSEGFGHFMLAGGM